MVIMVPVEIAQYEEAAESESSPPKRPWDPIIEPIPIPRGRVIAHHGRSVLVIVAFDVRRFLTV